MNPRIMQVINQIKSIRNPQQAAMQALNQAAKQGNKVAENILSNIQSGNMAGAENILNNFMGEQGVSIDEINQMISRR